MRVWLKHGLVRVAAFVIVGIVVVVSTQILRGQNPEDVSIRLKTFVRDTISSWVSAPGGSESPEAAVQSSVEPPEDNLAAGELPTSAPVPAAAPKTLTFAAAQVTAPTIEVPEYCKITDVSAGSIVMGDKIQLRFFAAVRIPGLDAGSSTSGQLDSVAYERLDLSGVYDIDEDGTAALPLIGRINLVGRSLACAEALVASEIAAQDGSISTVTAAFSARLPVTVGGAVRAPGSYTHAPGMTVNRLLNLAGASFGEGPIMPQELESLLAQRNEMLLRQLLAAIELGRLEANIAGKDEIVIADRLVANVPAPVFADLIAIEAAALRQDLSVSRISAERDAVAIAGLEQNLKDARSQLATVDTQISSLQVRNDDMATFKSRGLIQASQLDGLISHLMELTRIGKQLETEQSNLKSQIDLAKEDARLAVEVRLQDFSRRAATLAGEISLYDVQLSAIGSRLAGHGIGTESDDFELPLAVSVMRTEVSGAYRFDATLDTVIFPGDMITISLPVNLLEKQVTAENDVPGDVGVAASGSLQP